MTVTPRVFINRLIVTYFGSFVPLYLAVHWMSLFFWIGATAAMRLARREPREVLVVALVLVWCSLVASGLPGSSALDVVGLFWVFPAAWALVFHHVLRHSWMPMVLIWMVVVALAGLIWPRWLVPETWHTLLAPGHTHALVMWHDIATWSAHTLLFFVAAVGVVMMKVAMEVPWSHVAQQLWAPERMKPMLVAWLLLVLAALVAASGLFGHEAWAQAFVIEVAGMSWLWGVLWWCFCQQRVKVRWWHVLVGLAVAGHPLGFWAGALLVPLAWVPVLRGK